MFAEPGLLPEKQKKGDFIFESLIGLKKAKMRTLHLYSGQKDALICLFSLLKIWTKRLDKV